MQGVANRLAGQHMAYLLRKAGLPTSAAGLQLPEAVAIRKAGVAAGLAQELNLYRKSNSKVVFLSHPVLLVCAKCLEPSQNGDGMLGGNILQYIHLCIVDRRT